MTLYEMSQTARQLYELLDAGEIDEQAVMDTMESIGVSEKLEAYCHIQKQLEAEIAAFEAEIERMMKRKASLEKNVQRMKDAQVEFMLATNQRKAAVGTFTLRISENRSCQIIDEAKIPAQYLVTIPASTRPDKKAMLAALKAGEEISGVSLKTSYSVITK